MASSRRRSEPSTHTSSRIPRQTKRTPPWIILSFSCSATALNLYNSDFAVVASRAWTVSTVTGHPAWGAQITTRARHDETLVDRQIDAKLAIGRHQVARHPASTSLIVSAVRASLLKHAFGPLLALLRFGDGLLAHLVCVCGAKVLGHQRSNNFGKSPLWTAHRPVEHCEVQIDPLLPTLHFSVDGEIEVVSINHALLRHVLDPMRTIASLIAWLMRFLRQHGGAFAQFGNSVFRVAVHGLNEDVRDTWHEQDSADTRAGNEPADVVGEQRELPCWASRNLVEIVAGHQELGLVFVAQEELVVRLPCWSAIERTSSIHSVMLPSSNEKMLARSKRTKNLNPATLASSSRATESMPESRSERGEASKTEVGVANQPPCTLQ